MRRDLRAKLHAKVLYGCQLELRKLWQILKIDMWVIWGGAWFRVWMVAVSAAVLPIFDIVRFGFYWSRDNGIISPTRPTIITLQLFGCSQSLYVIAQIDR